MCKSNYDIVLAGANVGACAGAGFACIVVRWLDCELKRPTMFKKSCLKGKYVQQKRSLAANVQTNLLGDIPFSVFCAHQMLTLGMRAKMFAAKQSSKK